MKSFSLSLLALLTLSPSLLAAKPAATVAQEEQAVRAAGEQFAEAFNRGDAAAVAAHYAPDAVFVNLATGAKWQGRQEIEKQLAQQFANSPKVKLTLKNEAVRVVSPQLALARGIVTETHADTPPQETAFAVVYEKQDGKWLLTRATQDLVEAAAAGADQLKQLGWMVGTWMYEGDDAVRVETTVEWVDNQNFLQRTFRVFQGQEAGPTGTELITFDPAGNQLRSYITNSDGSHGEGVWNVNGDRWVVEETGTLANGEKFSATETYRFVNDNAYVWQSTDRVEGGQSLPDTREVLVARMGTIDTTTDAE